MAQERGLPLTTFVRVMIEIGMGQLTVLEALERYHEQYEHIAREILARDMATAVQVGVDKEKLAKGFELASQVIASSRRPIEEAQS
jgi:hypothetical protein